MITGLEMPLKEGRIKGSKNYGKCQLNPNKRILKLTYIDDPIAK